MSMDLTRGSEVFQAETHSQLPRHIGKQMSQSNEHGSVCVQ